MSKRFFGFDLHKNFIVAAALDINQEVIVKPRRINSADLEEWVHENITKDDEVVIEAMGCSWIIYDLLVQYAARVVVAHPYHVKLIASSFVKTDNGMPSHWQDCWQPISCRKSGCRPNRYATCGHYSIIAPT